MFAPGANETSRENKEQEVGNSKRAAAKTRFFSPPSLGDDGALNFVPLRARVLARSLARQLLLRLPRVIIVRRIRLRNEKRDRDEKSRIRELRLSRVVVSR